MRPFARPAGQRRSGVEGGAGLEEDERTGVSRKPPSSLRSLACLTNDYAIACVGRLYLCVDVAPVEARSATSTVAGIAVVYVEEVIAREPIYSVLVVGVGIRVDTVEVA